MEPNSARYESLFLSDYFSIHEFVSHASERSNFKPNITTQFCINLPRTGYFTYYTFRQNLEEHRNRVLIEKPDTEFKLTQESAGIGICTVIHFSDKGFNAIKSHFPCEKSSFFSDQDKSCGMFGLSPSADFLHHDSLNYLKIPGRCHFQAELMVVDLIENILSQLTELPTLHFAADKIKCNHVLTVDRAKAFLFDNMSCDINLSMLARHCCVSPFHLVRLFKRICLYSPFYYLQQIRLKYAQTLLTTTQLPITDVCFRSRFTRLDYFSSAFAKQFSVSPSRYKAMKSGNS